MYALSENRYILNASELDGSILDGGAMSVIIACSTRDLVELQKIRKVLWKLPIEQYVCKMWKTTEDELKDIEIRYENLRRIAPDKLELFERIMKERSEE